MAWQRLELMLSKTTTYRDEGVTASLNPHLILQMRNDHKSPQNQPLLKGTDLQRKPSQPNIFIKDKHQSYMVPAWQTLTGESKHMGKCCVLSSCV